MHCPQICSVDHFHFLTFSVYNRRDNSVSSQIRLILMLQTPQTVHTFNTNLSEIKTPKKGDKNLPKTLKQFAKPSDGSSLRRITSSSNT